MKIWTKLIMIMWLLMPLISLVEAIYQPHFGLGGTIYDLYFTQNVIELGMLTVGYALGVYVCQKKN